MADQDQDPVEDTFYILLPGSYSPFTVAHLATVRESIQWALERPENRNNKKKIVVKIIPSSNYYSKDSVFLPKPSADGSIAGKPHQDYISEEDRILIIQQGLDSPDIETLKGGSETVVECSVDTTEIDLAKNRKRTIGTGDLLKYMKEQRLISQDKKNNMVLYGADNIIGMAGWADPMSILDVCTIGAINRDNQLTQNDDKISFNTETLIKSYIDNPGNEITKNMEYPVSKFTSVAGRENIIELLQKDVKIVPLPLFDFSSSLLRKIARGQQLSAKEFSEIMAILKFTDGKQDEFVKHLMLTINSFFMNAANFKTLTFISKPELRTLYSKTQGGKNTRRKRKNKTDKKSRKYRK